MFEIVKNDTQKLYKVYNVRYDSNDGETNFLIYDTDMQGWYWIMACDCIPCCVIQN